MDELEKFDFVPLGLSADGPVWGRTQDSYIVGDIQNPTMIPKDKIRNYRQVVYRDGKFQVEEAS